MSTVEMDLENIREVAKTLSNSANDILDRSIGPDKECLSAQEFVTCLEEGVSIEKRKHLVECEFCRTNFTAFESNKPLESGRAFVESLLTIQGDQQNSDDIFTSFFKRVRDKFSQLQRVPVPAILALDKIFEVVDVTDKNLVLICELIPGFEPSRLRKIEAKSLRLDGAIKAKGSSVSTLDFNQDGRVDALQITFKSGQLAPRVRKAINRGQSVIDTIRLTGDFTDSKTSFLGQANLQFQAPRKKKQDLKEELIG